MKNGQKFSQKDLCKFSTEHVGFCYKTKNNWGVAVAEENLCQLIGKHLLVDEDGNYLGDDTALFAKNISSDNDTKSPKRLMRAQIEIIGAAADSMAKHLPDKNHVLKNSTNDIYTYRGKDKTVGSGVSGLSNERIALIKSDLNKIANCYSEEGIGVPEAKKKAQELVDALILHHCGNHSLCKHPEFCTYLRVKTENPELSDADVATKAAAISMRSHQLSLDDTGRAEVTAIIKKRFGPKSIDNAAAGGSSNYSEAFWNVLTKFSEGKKLNVDHSNIWTAINHLVFIRSGDGNVQKTNHEISALLSLPVTCTSMEYREKADKKRSKDQARAKSDGAKQTRIINKITKNARMGKEDMKKSYKTEKVKLSETQTSRVSKKPRGPQKCSKCGGIGHTAKICKMPRASKKRNLELSDFELGDLDFLEECLKTKRLKLIDVEDLDCFDDILS